MQSIYNSWSASYKTPFGAVASGTKVTFTLRVPQEYGSETPYLFIKNEESGETQQILLTKMQNQNGRDIFTIEYTPERQGLYFYWFDLWRDYKKLYQGAQGNALESVQEGGRPYQLTVFDPNFNTPKDIKGGVMYQIFPDRFSDGAPNTHRHYNERIYRAEKTREPYFWPNNIEKGFLTLDYFGGDLEGIQQKLPYLISLGVNIIYLNPIFEAHSNHRYNTADYMTIDPDLGTNKDFVLFCKEAKKAGIQIILDGVFSHTGSDSIYFNLEGRYNSCGAWQSADSPYRPWYHFKEDGTYESWWGFKTLPACNKENPEFRDFICGVNGVIDTWLQRGAAGFRLDVADELPDDFIAAIRTAVKRNGEDKLLIGEVWEDASNKEAYGVRRKYFLGQELDGVMNYPFRSAILDFVKNFSAQSFAESVMNICEHYPKPAIDTCTTHLSTHDTVRAITAISGEVVADHDRNWQSGRRLSAEVLNSGISRLKLAFALQFVLPGIPCVYYGDELAMQGYKDPFNRCFFEWDNPEPRLKEVMREFAVLRKEHSVFADGDIGFLQANSKVLILRRENSAEIFEMVLNASDFPKMFKLFDEEIAVAPMRWAWRFLEK